MQPNTLHDTKEVWYNHATRYPDTLYRWLYMDSKNNLRSYNSHIIYLLTQYALANGYSPDGKYPEPVRAVRAPKHLAGEMRYQRQLARKAGEAMVKNNKLLQETGLIDFVDTKDGEG